MKLVKRLIVVTALSVMTTFAGDPAIIDIGTFNIRFFPCNEDGSMMKKYDIEMRYPPQGSATDTTMLFNLLRDLNIEILGVEEIVDPPLFGAMAKRQLGDKYEFIYAATKGWQKVGILFDSTRVQLIGQPKIYPEIALGDPDRLRPALSAYFKSIPDGFDFHVIVVHLKASPKGWPVRDQQWGILENILASIQKGENPDSDVILLGDFNNVSEKGIDEFLPRIGAKNYFWAGSGQENFYSSYWKPDWKKAEIKGSWIDQIVISADAQVEFIKGSLRSGGLCSDRIEAYTDSIPEYFSNVSDHCPVVVSFEAVPDRD